MASFGLNLVIFIAIMIHHTMAQTTHIVGDTLGWTIAPGGASAYTTWASQQTFTVGDILVFNFTNGQHDVAEVSAAAYDPCTSTNPISLTTTGPASLTLTTTGMHYYICTFTSHCQAGQKLTINVLAAGATTPPTTPSSPPTTAITPPTITPPTEPCPPTGSPTESPLSPPTITSGNNTPPPPGSGASSFNAMVPVSLLAIGLAFLNY